MIEQLNARVQESEKQAQPSADQSEDIKSESLEELRKQLADKDLEISKLKDEIAENSFVPVRAVPPGSRLQPKTVSINVISQAAQDAEGSEQKDKAEEAPVDESAKPPQGAAPMGEVNFAAQIAAMKAKK